MLKSQVKWNRYPCLQHILQITMSHAHFTSRKNSLTTIHIQSTISCGEDINMNVMLEVYLHFFFFCHGSIINFHNVSSLSNFKGKPKFLTCDGIDQVTNQIMNATTLRPLTFHIILDLFYVNRNKLLHILWLWSLPSQRPYFTVRFPSVHDLLIFSVGLLNSFFD